MRETYKNDQRYAGTHKVLLYMTWVDVALFRQVQVHDIRIELLKHTMVPVSPESMCLSAEDVVY
jgi:hypothetical protein